MNQSHKPQVTITYNSETIDMNRLNRVKRAKVMLEYNGIDVALEDIALKDKLRKTA